MGKKMSPETVEKIARINTGENKSIFNTNNKYGYKINVSHPWVRPLYEKYKDKLGKMILSDKERLEFERIIIEFIENKQRELAERRTAEQRGLKNG